MAQDDIEQKIKLNYETNAETTAKSVDKLDKSIDKTSDSQKKATKSSQDQKKGLEDLGGGLGSAVSGFKALIKQAWLLVANPVGAVIVAIVGGLTLLFKAFTSTKAGAEKFDQVMAGISATVDVVRDRILKFASAMGKFLTGDFSGAMADAKGAVSGFGDEVKREFEIAANATKSLQEVADAMRDLGVSRAKLNRDLVEAKEIINDENAAYSEKVDAIKKVQAAEEEQTRKELANAQKKLDAIIIQNAQSDSDSEALQRQADAEIALFNIQEKSASDKVKNLLLQKKADNEEKSRIKEIQAVRNAVAKEQADNRKKELDDIAALASEKLKQEETALRQLQDLNDKTEEEKLARNKQRALDEIAILEQKGIDVRNLLIYNDELYNTLEDELREKRNEEKAEAAKVEAEKALAIQKEEAQKQKDIDDAILEQKKAVEEAKIGLVSSGLNLIKNIFSKNKKVQKGILLAENAAGLASVAINTVKAVGAATAASPLTGGMPFAGISIAQGAIGAANIIASTAKGLKELGGGSAGSADSISSGSRGGGASAAPQVGFQISSENQIASTIATNTNEAPPIEAFVVESSITTKQALARKKAESNSF